MYNDNIGELEEYDAYDGQNEYEQLGTQEYKEYAKAYKNLLQSVLNLRFSWEKDPEDFLALVLLTYKAIMNGEVEPLTDKEIAAGMVAPDVDTVAAVFDEWISVDYGSYQNFQQLRQTAIPSDTIFNEEYLALAESKRISFDTMHEVSHADGAHMITSPLYTVPHPITKMWAEAFTVKLAERMKLYDESLCEILLGHTIHLGAYMVI
ncbi:hypothetical protein HNQ91_001036 [Filimonas zeae]|uniref:Uncharacterized protein n=1 Tax=Filimonas zeae TaxID=1737353 RepID=A0A917IR14_9BACT|nr:hypothetical protein [Filimonas zeae]MDR6338014.1 hypothetical protein [Filimonas zeae]GGH61296.1 hypothetical protein GCM10011379_10130 [Filimonas zeae]